MPASRFIVIDTETTGLDVRDGHRIIEIGCVAVDNFQVTGDSFHRYLNPECAIDPQATVVHGLRDQDVRNAPVFAEVAEEFLDYIRASEIVMHNASFDLEFLNEELRKAGHKQRIEDLCNVVDSLEIAQKKHGLQQNNLDVLCKRYNVDNVKRQEAHGALVDAELLAHVYIKMTAGEVGLFNVDAETESANAETLSIKNYARSNVIVVKSTPEELERHRAYLEEITSEISS